ncbi:PREDICTED: stimulator of interferon genes protein [Polistes dominula]|uniref:Stimulator of interferon genes protein n=1 Tax=Polistes dominula TaxID=743375 RepID=A0ABM1IZK5_POLDO|nr:PREDICTED: stimulator of interferon genes protein [Polistes dominula]
MNKNIYVLSNVSLKIVFYFILEILLIGVAIGAQYDVNVTYTICNIFCIVSMLIIIHILCDLMIQFCNVFQPNLKYYGIQQLEVSLKYKITIGVCIIILCSQTMNQRSSYIWTYNNVASICSYCFVIILFKTLILSEQNVDIDISSMKGLDYGTGMAYSYYYGYLRIVLPSTGTASKGLIEKLENIEDSHNISISIKKLFILIPSSTYISSDFKDCTNGWMESALELEKEVRDRAGVKNRSYHNNVYKIYPEGKKPCVKPEYITVEGATPLLTMFEVQKHFHPESAIYAKYRKQIIKSFYLKLKDIIYNDPECRELCELIYYEDYNSDGTKVNVAKIILEKISELRSLQ